MEIGPSTRTRASTRQFRSRNHCEHGARSVFRLTSHLVVATAKSRHGVLKPTHHSLRSNGSTRNIECARFWEKHSATPLSRLNSIARGSLPSVELHQLALSELPPLTTNITVGLQLSSLCGFHLTFTQSWVPCIGHLSSSFAKRLRSIFLSFLTSDNPALRLCRLLISGTTPLGT